MDDRLASLQSDPWSFDLFEAMRLIDAVNADLPPIGKASGPHDEAVRIGAEPSLDFSPSNLTEDRSGGETGDQTRLQSRGFGLLGPNGPLPLSVTEEIRASLLHDNDAAPLHFIEALQHRLVALFYRSHAQARPTLQADRPETDRFAVYLGALFGGHAGAADRDRFRDDSRLYFTGRNSAATRSTEALEAIIGHEFPGDVRVTPFSLGWLSLEPSLQTSLGATGPSAQLGVAAIAGSRVRDRQSQIHIEIGPLSADEFRSYLPGGENNEPLADLVREFTRGELFCTLQLVVRKEDAPSLRLGHEGTLGQTAWLGHAAPDHDPSEATFALA